GLTPLHYAAGAGRAEVIRELLGHGADKEQPSVLVGTPLEHAARKGQLPAVEALLVAHASLGFKAYQQAAVGGRANVFRVLAMRQEFHKLEPRQLRELLLSATRGGSREIVERVAQQLGQAPLFLPNEGPEHPLHVAAEIGRTDLIDFFLNRGESVDVPD